MNANVVLTDPTGATTLLPMTCTNPGLDFWQVTVSAPTTGRWSFRVEGWSDPYGTWHHDAAIKIAADVDTEMMLEEGALVLERAVSSVERTPEQAAVLTDAIGKLRDRSHSPGNRLGAGVSHAVEAELAARPLRDYVTAEPGLPVAGGAGAGALRRLVRVLPAVGGLRARPRHRPVEVRHLRDRRRAAAGRRGEWVSTSST